MVGHGSLKINFLPPPKSAHNSGIAIPATKGASSHPRQRCGMVDGAAWVGRQLVEIGGGGCERKKEKRYKRRPGEGERDRRVTVKGTEKSFFFPSK